MFKRTLDRSSARHRDLSPIRSWTPETTSSLPLASLRVERQRKQPIRWLRTGSDNIWHRLHQAHPALQKARSSLIMQSKGILTAQYCSPSAGKVSSSHTEQVEPSIPTIGTV